MRQSILERAVHYLSSLMTFALLAPSPATVCADEAEEQAVKHLEKLGATVERDENAPGKPVVLVSLMARPATDADLKKLAVLKHLQWLSLTHTKITDGGLKELASLQELYLLFLGYTSITDAGLPNLAPLKKLKELGLSGTKITDAGLKKLAPLKNLEMVYLVGTQVTAAGLAELAQLPNLQTLELSDTKLTCAGFQNLGFLKKVRVIFSGTQPVNDQTLQSLGQAGLLHVLPGAKGEKNERVAGQEGVMLLDLSDTQITDAGLKELAPLKNLRVLKLRGTEVTDAGLIWLSSLQKLQELERPALKITDQTLRSLGPIGLLHVLDQAEGPMGKRPKTSAEIIALNLQKSQVTATGIAELSVLKNLKVLRLDKHQINDEVLKCLGPAGLLPTLGQDGSLDLSSTAVTDQGLKELTHWPGLQKLLLDGTATTIKGIRELKTLKKLQCLSLNNIEITDAALMDLGALRNLQQLHLQNTKITSAGFQVLEKVLPTCKINKGAFGCFPE